MNSYERMQSSLPRFGRCFDHSVGADRLEPEVGSRKPGAYFMTSVMLRFGASPTAIVATFLRDATSTAITESVFSVAM